MKYYDAYVKSHPKDKRYKSALEKYERQNHIDLDMIDNQDKFKDFCLWIQGNYGTTSAYQRRAAAKRYLDFVCETLGKEKFDTVSMNYTKNRYNDNENYDKDSCQFLFYDQMMEYINSKIANYIDEKAELGQPSELLWSGFNYHQAIFTLIWNGYHPNYLPSIKITDINIENHTILDKKITKGWNYIESLINQKYYHKLRGKGKVVEEKYYGNVYLFKHRTLVEGNKRYEPVTRDEIRSIMTGFTNNVLDGDFSHPTEIMYNGAISHFFKTDEAHGVMAVVIDSLREFAENYCIGYSSLPSKKMLYVHFEVYKKNLLKYLMDKYNIVDLL